MKAIGHQGCRYVRMKMQTMISFIVDNSRLGEEYIRGKLQMAKEALMEKTRGGSRAREDNRGSFGDSGKEGGTGKVPLKADGFPKSPDRPEYTTPRLRRPWS
ncbi:hypothetical protein EV356DRAFT_509813 [Viridothelium virens]|uniref:Uncharacterized protein n=1 Tax=Viridothelium virens TaxID=1048519 RepID=A0A6A6HK50_VIRVR|nr:hypothetical protein EV356DRAFT_509813 [Viridothelium virens]